MTKTSWVEICVSNFQESLHWFENVLGFRVVTREENEYADLRLGETSIQLACEARRERAVGNLYHGAA